MEVGPAHGATAKGPRFVKFYGAGLDRIDALLTMKGGPMPGRLWVWLRKHAGSDNAVVVTAELLAKELGCDRRTIYRAADALEKAGAVVVGKVGGTSVYVLDARETFRGMEENKRFVGFSARTLVAHSENKGFRERLASQEPQPSLPGVGDLT